LTVLGYFVLEMVPILSRKKPSSGEKCHHPATENVITRLVRVIQTNDKRE
jgi:hypothetical protein